MSEVDPDPNLPDEGQGRAELGGRGEPAGGDPTEGGKRGEIGEAPSIAADQPDDGSTFPPGGGRVEDEGNAPPVADPGRDA
ncbi:hypothetical protein ACI8AF_13990 [Blastococcus sp. SYSU D00669]